MQNRNDANGPMKRRWDSNNGGGGGGGGYDGGHDKRPTYGSNPRFQSNNYGGGGGAGNSGNGYSNGNIGGSGGGGVADGYQNQNKPQQQKFFRPNNPYEQNTPVPHSAAPVAQPAYGNGYANKFASYPPMPSTVQMPSSIAGYPGIASAVANYSFPPPMPQLPPTK